MDDHGMMAVPGAGGRPFFAWTEGCPAVSSGIRKDPSHGARRGGVGREGASSRLPAHVSQRTRPRAEQRFPGHPGLRRTGSRWAFPCLAAALDDHASVLRRGSARASLPLAVHAGPGVPCPAPALRRRWEAVSCLFGSYGVSGVERLVMLVQLTMHARPKKLMGLLGISRLVMRRDSLSLRSSAGFQGGGEGNPDPGCAVPVHLPGGIPCRDARETNTGHGEAVANRSCYEMSNVS
ncbi:hypothetical protein SAMN05421505_11932 [Sinosporangium album]|uniref:Uncharacterized protein n=1 Tax=Sinosporangium album TaxID=504805 RepID=A0A1G8DWY8_9ACTN|nr:hypothetical protein SAMN05421505_11932 [Sinosporangium album]